jgi:hypothetical protein
MMMPVAHAAPPTRRFLRNAAGSSMGTRPLLVSSKRPTSSVLPKLRTCDDAM